MKKNKIGLVIGILAAAAACTAATVYIAKEIKEMENEKDDNWGDFDIDSIDEEDDVVILDNEDSGIDDVEDEDDVLGI